MSRLASGIARHERALVVALIAMITALQWLALAPGHDWGDDFAMYVTHARNLAEGRPYTDTRYVFNPEHPRLGPRNYPPVTPALLSLPYRLFGFDLEAMKRSLVLLFPCFLGALYVTLRPRMGRDAGPMLLLLAAVGFAPIYWQIERSIVSEIPFLFFLYLAFALFDRLETSRAPAGSDFVLAAAVGLVFYLAYGTRSVGAALFPAVVVHDLLRFRRLRAVSIVALGVVVPLALGEAWWLGVLDDYGASVSSGMGAGPTHGLLDNLLHAALTFPIVLSWAWRGELPLAFEGPFALLLFGLALLGLIGVLRRGPALHDWFALAYVAMLSLLPFGGDLRRLAPVLPLFFYYVVQGVRFAPWLGAPGRRRWLALGVAAGLAISYAELFARLDWGSPPDGVHRATAQELFAFVRSQTGEPEVCVFFKPRALALFTGCRSAVYHASEDPGSFDRFFSGIGATLFIVKRDLGPEDALARWAAARGPRLTPVFENADFIAYRWQKEAPAPAR